MKYNKIIWGLLWAAGVVAGPAYASEIKTKVVKGTVGAKSTSSMSVSENGVTYTVNLNANTVLRRKFGAKSSLDEISTGDTVNVIGKFTDDAKTAILARMIRDLSVQKRKATFVGEITSLTSGGFVMSTVSEKRTDQTVTISTTTKLVNRKEVTIVQTDLKVGDRVRVKGMWNNDTSTVTEVTQVKDYSLPQF